MGVPWINVLFRNRGISKETIDKALLGHEYRMVGSKTYKELKIKKAEHETLEKIAVVEGAVGKFRAFNCVDDYTTQTTEITYKTQKTIQTIFYLLEYEYMCSWNKYLGTNKCERIGTREISSVIADKPPTEWEKLITTH